MDVLLDVDGPVALVTLNRPAKLNAVTPDMAAALRECLGRIDADPAIRVAVLTGAGERSFCVGSDIGELDAYETPWEFRNRGDYGDAVRALRKPIVAAVNGYACGGGLELALACDIRLAAGTATFAAPEIKLGWIGGNGQSALLAHSVGPGQRGHHAADRRPHRRGAGEGVGPGHRRPPQGRADEGRPRAGREDRGTPAHRGADRQGQPQGRLLDAARPGHPVRAGPADRLLRDRRRGRGQGRVRRPPRAGLRGALMGVLDG
nr:enoyl-CoA hydratase/isomerase family protein [Nonomuraea sp. SYSU D8015]